MKWHWETLDAGRKEFLLGLGKSGLLGRYYLAGGTGLALIAGHRKSVDFDFFAHSTSLILPDADRMRRHLARMPDYRLRHMDKGTLHAGVGGVQISFLATPYPLLESPLNAGRFRVAHPVDIGLMKLNAIMQRGGRKDFIDLVRILDEGLTLKGLLDLAPKKYGASDDFSFLVLKSLLYFADAEDEADPVILDDRYRWDKARIRVEKEVKRILPQFLGK